MSLPEEIKLMKDEVNSLVRNLERVQEASRELMDLGGADNCLTTNDDEALWKLRAKKAIDLRRQQMRDAQIELMRQTRKTSLGQPIMPSTPTPIPAKLPASSSKTVSGWRSSIRKMPWPHTPFECWIVLIWATWVIGFLVYITITQGYTGSWKQWLTLGNAVLAGAASLKAVDTLGHIAELKRADRIRQGHYQTKKQSLCPHLNTETGPVSVRCVDCKKVLDQRSFTPEGPKMGLFPPDVFEPYCVCPVCGVEALHWMHPTTEMTGKREKFWGPAPTTETPFEIIRTCREDKCGVSWSQNATTILPKTEVATHDDAVLEDKADTLAEINEARNTQNYQGTEDPGLQSGWSVLGNTVNRQGHPQVPAPITDISAQRAIDTWQDAFMDGMAPERTDAERYVLDQSTFGFQGLSTGATLDDAEANALGRLKRADALATPSHPDIDEDGKEVATRMGGELSTSDAQAKVGHEAVKRYREAGGKMTITGPGGMVISAKNPETGIWESPGRKRIFHTSDRGEATALNPSHTKALPAGEPLDVEEVELPEGDSNA